MLSIHSFASELSSKLQLASRVYSYRIVTSMLANGLFVCVHMTGIWWSGRLYCDTVQQYTPVAQAQELTVQLIADVITLSKVHVSLC